MSRQGWGDKHRGFVCSGKLSAQSGTEQSHLSQGLSPSPQCRQVSPSICVHFNGWKSVSVLFNFFLVGFFFPSNKHLNSLSKQLCCLFPPLAPAQKVSASHGLKGGWRKTTIFILQGAEGREKQSDSPRLICGKAEPPVPNPTSCVILALYAFNKNRFGPRNQTPFMLNAA